MNEQPPKVKILIINVSKEYQNKTLMVLLNADVAAPLVKLYYRNSEKAAAAVKEFLRLKKQRRGPMSERALKNMMVKFEQTGKLGVLPGRGQKGVNTAAVEDNIHHFYLTVVGDRFELYYDRGASFIGNVHNPESKKKMPVRKRYHEMLQTLRNSYSPATRLSTRNHIHARWIPTSHRELSPTIVKAVIYRRTCDQLIFPNNLASTITLSQTLRLLVMGLFER
ncbi:hypothetical protein TNCV_2389961 [Trichonephila clavipes]|nr:hypothetical protein TNCV_2389961 [Trichonephila clavipes]